MAKDYAAISKKIVENIGGVENIASVTHCMTRLRFVVKDEGKINDAAVKATDGVMGVVNQGGQYQIIIGNHVEEAYNEVLKMGDFGEASQVARGEKKEPLTLKKVGNNILDAIVGTMSPLIPAIIGGSMVKLLVMLLGMVGVLSADGETYKILNTIGDAAFYFLPVMVAASASKKFNTNIVHRHCHCRPDAAPGFPHHDGSCHGRRYRRTLPGHPGGGRQVHLHRHPGPVHDLDPVLY